MNKICFTDLDGTYSLLEYNRSHSQLLLRKRVNKNGYSNIDIIFNYVKYISIPTEIIGIEISILVDQLEINSLKNKFIFNTDFGYSIYGIKNLEGQKFYLNAGLFGIFANNLDILKSSLGDFTWSEFNKLIYWSGTPPTSSKIKY